MYSDWQLDSAVWTKAEFDKSEWMVIRNGYLETLKNVNRSKFSWRGKDLLLLP